MDHVTLIECPRDAWQGLPRVIPTDVKVRYLRRLIECGFGCLDAVSFVSPAHVPQMADSEQVVKMLESDVSRRTGRALAEIIGIVVNRRGLERALAAPGVSTVGYPHSISERFLRQNANLSVAESRKLVEEMSRATCAAGRGLVVYVSMAFGNPYGETWQADIVAEEVRWLRKVGVRTLSLADTVGRAGARDVGCLFRAVRESLRDGGDAVDVEIGVHLHSRPEGSAEKVLAAYDAGCRRFDCALTGLGGCPFADDELVGNIPTEIVVQALSTRGVPVGLEPQALLAAVEATKEIRRQFVE